MSRSKAHLTVEQYLEIERRAEFKSEFCDGEMFAMAGAREAHNALVWNLLGQLFPKLRPRGCRGYPSDMRVRTATGLFTYPDVVVVCGEPQFLDHRRDTLLNPTLIIEVLSPSTEAYDRGRKFEHYRSIASLTAYLLVASDRTQIDAHAKQPGGQWLLTSASAPEEAIELNPAGCRLTVSDIYQDVALAEPE